MTKLDRRTLQNNEKFDFSVIQLLKKILTDVKGKILFSVKCCAFIHIIQFPLKSQSSNQR